MITVIKTLVYGNYSFSEKEKLLKKVKGEKIIIILLAEEGHLKLKVSIKIKNIDYKIVNLFWISLIYFYNETFLTMSENKKPTKVDG